MLNSTKNLRRGDALTFETQVYETTGQQLAVFDRFEGGVPYVVKYIARQKRWTKPLPAYFFARIGGPLHIQPAVSPPYDQKISGETRRRSQLLRKMWDNHDNEGRELLAH